LFLPVRAQRKDTIARGEFGKWIIEYVERCLVFAQQLGLGLVHMEDIILVTGYHRTKSWANVAFMKSHTDAQPEVSFRADVTNNNDSEVINWRFSPDRSRGAELNLGPDGEVCCHIICEDQEQRQLSHNFVSLRT
jgi:hypothetical protein